MIEAYKRDVDRTLLRENLRLAPEERILAAMELQKLAEGGSARGPRGATMTVTDFKTLLSPSWRPAVRLSWKTESP